MPDSDRPSIRRVTLSCMVAAALAGTCPRLVVASQAQEGRGNSFSFLDDVAVGEAQDQTSEASPPSDADVQVRLLEILTASPGLDGEDLAERIGESVHRVTVLLDELEARGLLVEVE